MRVCVPVVVCMCVRHVRACVMCVRCVCVCVMCACAVGVCHVPCACVRGCGVVVVVVVVCVVVGGGGDTVHISAGWSDEGCVIIAEDASITIASA